MTWVTKGSYSLIYQFIYSFIKSLWIFTRCKAVFWQLRDPTFMHWYLYQVARTAVLKYHTLGGLKWTISQFWRLEV